MKVARSVPVYYNIHTEFSQRTRTTPAAEHAESVKALTVSTAAEY